MDTREGEDQERMTMELEMIHAEQKMLQRLSAGVCFRKWVMEKKK